MAKIEKKKIALLLFGGTGERFNSKMPKQFVNIGGKPLLHYAIKAFNDSPSINSIVIVCLPGTGKLTLSYCNKNFFTKVAGIVSGGSSRRESVLNGLRFILSEKIGGKNDIVLISDGDRPLVSESIIEGNIKEASSYGAAVTAIPSSDSLIRSSFGYEANDYLPRNAIFLAQTPQTFRLGQIWEAHEKANKSKEADKYTDDASIYLAYCNKAPKIVKGSKRNIKITEKEDAAIFVALKDNI